MSNYSVIVKEKVLKAINQYDMLNNTNEIIVGLSGGADSVCLLHILYSLKECFNYTLKAVHVNHGIRGEEADKDENFTKDFCLRYGVPIEIFCFKCADEAEKNKESIEECGRRLRYESFNKVCGDKSKIATAHNANDNAETVIFNITRGTSVKGLCGIPFVRDNIIRPLLLCSRKEIEGYCDENYLTYVIDSTNSSTEYTRNKIRHLVLPVLEDINPSYLESFNSLCNNAKSIADFLMIETEKLISESKISHLTYDKEVLLNADKAVVTELLCSEFYSFSDLVLDNKKVSSLYELLRSSGRIQLYGGFFAEVKKNYFRFYQVDDNCSDEIIAVSSIPFEATFGKYTVNLEKLTDYLKIVNQFDTPDMIDCNTISGSLVLRNRKAGDSFTSQKRNVTKTLKKLFTEENIPIEIRDKIPVISDDKGVVWVYGFGVTKRCCAGEHSDNIILVRGKNNDR